MDQADLEATELPLLLLSSGGSKVCATLLAGSAIYKELYQCQGGQGKKTE